MMTGDGAAMTVYLDHAATTTLRPAARDAMLDTLADANGNASGTHSVARAAKDRLEAARERAAEILGVPSPHDIVFTSGGTESDNLAVVGGALARPPGRVAISAIEHKAVLEPAHALERFAYAVDEIPCDADGIVQPEAVAGVVDEGTVLVSVMAANNEVGTVQPVLAIADTVRRSGTRAVVHTDAVQAFVGHDLTLTSTGADMISLSAHKFGGPKGVGILAVAPGTALEPIARGGGQEAGRRSGTANVAGVVGMVAAMEEVVADRDRFSSVVGTERDAFVEVLADRVGAVLTAATAERMPHVAHLRFPGRRAETALIRLDQAGIHAAAGSSCQSGAIEPSHVLTAMGMDAETAGECIRFTFGWDTAVGDGTRFAEAVAAVMASMAGVA